MNLHQSRTRPVVIRRLSLWGIAVALLCVGALDLGASVMVAPTVVFLSDRNPTGRLVLQNPTDAPTEVTIRFSWGLPYSDSLGNVQVTLQDTGITDPRSAVEWLKAFPRKVVIPPRGSQTVRLIAKAPKDLPDGEYWARIIVSSREGKTELTGAAEEGKIATQLNMVMQMAIMVKYRTGELVSDLELTGVTATTADSSVSVYLDMTSRGNVSYMGVLAAKLTDANGKLINESKTNLAVYRELRRRIDLHVSAGDFKRPYNVAVLITPDGRTDVPPEELVKGNKIEYSATVE